MKMLDWDAAIGKAAEGLKNRLSPGGSARQEDPRREREEAPELLRPVHPGGAGPRLRRRRRPLPGARRDLGLQGEGAGELVDGEGRLRQGQPRQGARAAGGLEVRRGAQARRGGDAHRRREQRGAADRAQLWTGSAQASHAAVGQQRQQQQQGRRRIQQRHPARPRARARSCAQARRQAGARAQGRAEGRAQGSRRARGRTRAAEERPPEAATPSSTRRSRRPRTTTSTATTRRR